MPGKRYPGLKDALLLIVKSKPGFRANDYSIWLYKQHGLAVPTNTVFSALKKMADGGLLRRELEPGPRTQKTPANWYCAA